MVNRVVKEKTRTSQTGILMNKQVQWSQGSLFKVRERPTREPLNHESMNLNSHKGFTLIELMVVVFLVTLMLTLAVPRVRESMFSDRLKATVNHLTNTARELRNDAIRNQVDYALHLDINNNLVSTYSADMTSEARDEIKKRAFQFPEGVKIVDIYRSKEEKISGGEATIKFFKRGYVQPSVIHLARGDECFTLIFHPFLSAVKTYDRYIEWCNCSGI